MTAFEPGDIVLVRFPFTDLNTAKKRPVLILSPRSYSSIHGDVVAVAVTSRDQGSNGLILKEWQSSGLLKPSWIKPVIGTLAIDLIERRLGKIGAGDRHQIAKVIKLMIDERLLRKRHGRTAERQSE